MFRQMLLDSLTEEEIQSNRDTLLVRFRINVLIAVVLELLLGAGAVMGITTWWDDGYVWTLFFKLTNFARAILLILTLRVNARITTLVGTGKFFKIPRTLARYWTLGCWTWMGFLDFFLFRNEIMVTDVIYLTVSSRIVTFQGAYYLVLDALTWLEFFFTLWLVYYVGIRYNVHSVLLDRTNRPKLSRKRGKKGRDCDFDFFPLCAIFISSYDRNTSTDFVTGSGDEFKVLFSSLEKKKGSPV
jgi:hypothetical protein